MARANRRLSLDSDLQFCFLSVPPHTTLELQRQHWHRLGELAGRCIEVGVPAGGVVQQMSWAAGIC